MAKKICSKCGRQMEDINFYTYKNGEKVDQCKFCLTMHVDNFDENTFLWILQKMDVPYVPEEWNILRDRAYAKNPHKMNGTSVIGKYLSKMKLKQWKDKSWADSAQLQAKRKVADAAREKQQQAHDELIKEQFERGQISQVQYRTLTSVEFQKQHEYLMSPPEVKNPIIPIDISAEDYNDPVGKNNFFREQDYLAEDDLPDASSQLTLEDKQKLAMKWGRTYKVSEWLQLQKNYIEMMNSFDIQDADSINTLIFICKTTLKMNQALDRGDVEEYQKLSRVYDQLRKSAKFTAAQNKEEKSNLIDSVGQLVAYCQKVGGQIPKYQITTPYDIIDKVINDLKNYNKNLIEQDTSLAKEIEDYIKEARAALAKKRDREQAKEQGLDAPELKDQDILDYKDFLLREKEATQREMAGD